ncbi:MAG: hypothetical protein ACOCTT_02890, partial [archaeon]
MNKTKLMFIVSIILGIFMFSFVSPASNFTSGLGEEHLNVKETYTDTIQRKNSDYNESDEESKEWINDYIIEVVDKDIEKKGENTYQVKVDVKRSEIGDYFVGGKGSLDYEEIADELNNDNITYKGGEWNSTTVEEMRQELEDMDFEVTMGEEVEIKNIPNGMVNSPEKDTHTL